MILECPKCLARFEIGAGVDVTGRKVRCSRCAHVWQVEEQATAVEPSPTPSRVAPSPAHARPASAPTQNQRSGHAPPTVPAPGVNHPAPVSQPVAGAPLSRPAAPHGEPAQRIARAPTTPEGIASAPPAGPPAMPTSTRPNAPTIPPISHPGGVSAPPVAPDVAAVDVVQKDSGLPQDREVAHPPSDAPPTDHRPALSAGVKTKNSGPNGADPARFSTEDEPKARPTDGEQKTRSHSASAEVQADVSSTSKPDTPVTAESVDEPAIRGSEVAQADAVPSIDDTSHADAPTKAGIDAARDATNSLANGSAGTPEPEPEELAAEADATTSDEDGERNSDATSGSPRSSDQSNPSVRTGAVEPLAGAESQSEAVSIPEPQPNDAASLEANPTQAPPHLPTVSQLDLQGAAREPRSAPAEISDAPVPAALPPDQAVTPADAEPEIAVDQKLEAALGDMFATPRENVGPGPSIGVPGAQLGYIDTIAPVPPEASNQGLENRSPPIGPPPLQAPLSAPQGRELPSRPGNDPTFSSPDQIIPDPTTERSHIDTRTDSPFTTDFTNDFSSTVPGERRGQHIQQDLSRRRAAVNLGWFCLAAIVGSVVGIVMLARDAVVQALPGAAEFYTAIGSPVNTRGLDFKDVSYAWTTDKGRPAITVKGKIRNVASVAMDVPTVVFVLLDDRGDELYNWASRVREDPIAAGAEAKFEANVPAPPGAARRLRVRFARKSR